MGNRVIPADIPLVLIIVCVIIGLCAISGLIRGFVRKISGIAAFILASILVNALLPTISSALRTTPVYTVILRQCEAAGDSLAQNAFKEALAGVGGSAEDAAALVSSVTGEDGSGSIDREKVRAELNARGYDPSIIDSLSDEELESYAQQLIGAAAGTVFPAFRAPAYGADMVLSIGPVLLSDTSAEGAGAYGDPGGGSSLLSQMTSGMDRADQIKFIESLPLPESLREQMETFNNDAGYKKLGAVDFGSYVVSYIASLILNIVAFLVTLIISWLLIWLIFGALSVFTHLPVIGAADRLLGLVLGVVQGVLIVWALFLLLSMFAASPAGKTLMDEIWRTPVLEALYNANPLMNGAVSAVSSIL